jgi:hypothetical protein
MEELVVVEERRKHDYSDTMEQPSIIYQILALFTFGRIFKQKTVWISRGPWYQFIVFWAQDLVSFCLLGFLFAFAISSCSIDRMDANARTAANVL